MILIGLGGNLPSPEYGEPCKTLEAVLERLEACGIQIIIRSQWFKSDPVPPSGQPSYVNGVVSVRTARGPEELLKKMHEVEQEFGRVRAARNAARIVDLDLLAYHDQCINMEESLTVPHPRMHDRSFVLVPLKEIAPGWRHPRLGLTVEELLEQTSDYDGVVPL